MRALFASAILAVGAFSSNSKSHGPWDMNVGQPTAVKQGAIGVTTDWAPTGGQDDIVELKYTMTITREQVMKDNANTQKLSLWWPNPVGGPAELDVLLMKAGQSVWQYKYGTVDISGATDGGVAAVAAATDPTDTYDFVWDS